MAAGVMDRLWEIRDIVKIVEDWEGEIEMPIRRRKAVPTGPKWIRQIFRAKAVRNGGIVRRKIASVQKYASAAGLEAEVRGRGFHMVISGDQYVILCHRGDFQVIC